MTLVKRLVKGSAITAAEHDGNMDHVLEMDNMVEGTATKIMTADERTKLDGVATGANNYTHPNHTGDVTSTGDGATVVKTDLFVSAQANNDLTSNPPFWVGTQGDYDALTPAAGTLYFIVEA